MIGKMAFTVLLAASGSAMAAQAEPMFNGRDFAGWKLRTDPAAAIADVFTVLPDGVIESKGKPSGFLATQASYRNYRLHVEWRWTAKPGNGGVLLHVSDGPMDRVWPYSLQVQTKHGAAGDLLPMAGATFAEPVTSAAGAQPVIKAHTAPDSELAAGEWNSADIVCRDGSVEVSVNGVVQNRVSQVKPSEGRIGFQLEGAPYQVRNVRLEKL